MERFSAGKRRLQLTKSYGIGHGNGSFDVRVLSSIFYAVEETAMNITNEMMFYGGMIDRKSVV